MGRRSRAERKAARKAKRAVNKIEKAERKEANGKTKRAASLRKRAGQLNSKAQDLTTKVNGQVVRGLSAKVSEVNSLGNVRITASWNYFSDELLAYDKLHLSLAPASPIRSAGWKDEGIVDSSASSYTFKLVKDLRYVVKLFGSQNGTKKLLDRTHVKKRD